MEKLQLSYSSAGPTSANTLETGNSQLPQPEKDANGKLQHFLSLLGGGACTHLLGEAVWPPRGGNELLQTCLLHTQRALDVEEHNRTEHVEAGLELKQAQKLQWEKGQGTSPEL